MNGNELINTLQQLIEIDAVSIVFLNENEYTGKLMLNIEIEQNTYNERIVNGIISKSRIPKRVTIEDIKNYLEKERDSLYDKKKNNLDIARYM